MHLLTPKCDSHTTKSIVWKFHENIGIGFASSPAHQTKDAAREGEWLPAANRGIPREWHPRSCIENSGQARVPSQELELMFHCACLVQPKSVRMVPILQFVPKTDTVGIEAWLADRM